MRTCALSEPGGHPPAEAAGGAAAGPRTTAGEGETPVEPGSAGW